MGKNFGQSSCTKLKCLFFILKHEIINFSCRSLNHYLKELDEVENRLNYDDQLKFRGRVQSLRQEAYDEIVAFVEVFY